VQSRRVIDRLLAAERRVVPGALAEGQTP
jgi:hypothetical protein